MGRVAAWQKHQCNHDAYNLERSSEKAFLMTSLLIFRAAVTKPDSGVHGFDSNLIFAGISNFSRRTFFATCRLVQRSPETIINQLDQDPSNSFLYLVYILVWIHEYKKWMQFFLSPFQLLSLLYMIKMRLM